MVRINGFRAFLTCMLAGVAALGALPACAGYDQPPKPLLDVLHAPSPASPVVNAQGTKILLVSPLQYPAMARVAEPFLRLAGVRIEPRNRSRHDTPAGYGIRACMHAFTLVDVATSKETKIAFPQGLCPSPPSWSGDGTQFAFENAASDSVELWVGDAASGVIHRIDGVRLNPMFDDALQWLGGGASLLVKLVPEGQGAPPADSNVPSGPDIQQAIGEKGESSTYEARDTLNSTHDEDLFDYYGASQLAVIDATSGSIRRVGKTALYTGVAVAPDGTHVLYEALKRPYSHAVTYERFAHDVGVLDLGNGHVQAIATLPLSDRVPVHGEPLGPRDFSWRQNVPATLVWAEALDQGDWKIKVPARDKVMMLQAPFTAKPIEVLRTEQRYAGFAWGAAPALAFLTEIDANRHWRKTTIVDIDAPKTKARVLWDMSSDERYKNPGSFVFRRLPNGAHVVRQDGEYAYLRGLGASVQGDRPFLDRIDLKSLATQRLFRSDAAAFDLFLAFGAAPGQFMVWHQSITDPPNAYMHTLGDPSDRAAQGEAAFTSSVAQVTHEPDPTPELRKIKKQLVKYKRADGVDLSFTLYTPPGYKEGTRLPAILYAYPQDFADAKQAGQVTGSQQTFTRLPPYRLLLLAGYAVIDNAAFPVVGDPKTAYDTYLQQLVADAQAAVDKAVELGVVDRERIGVTGHSHGALMTANLLAHSDLFRAGVATSGSYNKTLTPFGFQNERRSVWEAPKVYFDVSPFFSADKLKLPLLLVHGEDDANPGTEPIQSRKLYQAVRGNGGITRLVMLPHEPHWYTAMESNEQLVAEMLNWFDRYVKDAKPREAAPAIAH